MRVKSFARLAFIITGFYLNFNAVYASPMVYTPVNPSFGGNPFNGSTLLGEANANNHYVAPDKKVDSNQTFSDTINSAILSQLGSSLANQIYTTPNGTYANNGTKIVWSTTNGLKTVTVTDLSTGQVSTQQFTP